VHKFWSILFGAVLGASALLFIVAPFVGWWLPKDVCSFGPKVDGLFYLILAITGIAFIGTEVILVYALWRFPAQPGQKSLYTHGHHRLELFWTAIPAVILLFIAFAQVMAWSDIKYQSRMPDPDQVFEVSARQFEWRFRYPGPGELEKLTTDWKGKGAGAAAKWEQVRNYDDVQVVNQVHTWKGAKVRMYLKTKEVLHSFFLPNLRIKQDALPGKTIPVWYEATEANRRWDKDKEQWLDDPDNAWELACAELCGWGHYKMRGRLYVYETKADFERWLEQAAKKQKATSDEQ
jgi:cytochrome c oxidase subunit 2